MSFFFRQNVAKGWRLSWEVSCKHPKTAFSWIQEWKYVQNILNLAGLEQSAAEFNTVAFEKCPGNSNTLQTFIKNTPEDIQFLFFVT